MRTRNRQKTYFSQELTKEVYIDKTNLTLFTRFFYGLIFLFVITFLIWGLAWVFFITKVIPLLLAWYLILLQLFKLFSSILTNKHYFNLFFLVFIVFTFIYSIWMYSLWSIVLIVCVPIYILWYIVLLHNKVVLKYKDVKNAFKEVRNISDVNKLLSSNINTLESMNFLPKEKLRTRFLSYLFWTKLISVLKKVFLFSLFMWLCLFFIFWIMSAINYTLLLFFIATILKTLSTYNYTKNMASKKVLCLSSKPRKYSYIPYKKTVLFY